MDPDTTAQSRREEARDAALTFLASRSRLKFLPDIIRARVNSGGYDFSPGEILDALQFLVGRGFAEKSDHDMGATDYFQATSEGVLHYERTHF